MSSDAGPTATAHWGAFWPILQGIRTQMGGTNADLKGLLEVLIHCVDVILQVQIR